MILPLPCTVDNLQQNNNAQNLASLVCLRPSRFCRRPACLRPYYLRLRMSLRLTLLPSTTPPAVLVVLCDAFNIPASLYGHVTPAEASHHANHAPCLASTICALPCSSFSTTAKIVDARSSHHPVPSSFPAPPQAILPPSSQSSPPAILTSSRTSCLHLPIIATSGSGHFLR
jgi:hypothetical protein